jgi:hypothetical protein
LAVAVAAFLVTILAEATAAVLVTRTTSQSFPARHTQSLLVRVVRLPAPKLPHQTLVVKVSSSTPQLFRRMAALVAMDPT